MLGMVIARMGRSVRMGNVESGLARILCVRMCWIPVRVGSALGSMIFSAARLSPGSRDTTALSKGQPNQTVHTIPTRFHQPTLSVGSAIVETY